MNPIRIGQRLVGPGQPCFIIAEAGVNHNGSLQMAKNLVKAAAAVGADAVKFQTFTPEDVIVRDAPKAQYQLHTTSKGESQFDMLTKLALSYQDFRELKKQADELGIMFLSTGPETKDVQLLMELGIPALKVASMDIVNYPLLSFIGCQKTPVIASTGMATLGEVEAGLQALRNAGCQDVVLLHCITNYPIKDEEANLRMIDTLGHAFQVPVGFSDHTTGIMVPIAACARGACVIEKHFTLDRQLEGPDHAASLDPDGFRAMVEGIRTVESALGSPVKQPLPVELENRKAMRRSIVSAQDLPAGTVLERRHLCMKRPGTGLGSEFIALLEGRRTVSFIGKDSQLNLENTTAADSRLHRK